MKKLTVLLTLIMLICSAYAQKTWVPFTGDEPGQPQVTLQESDRAGVVFDVKITGMYSEDITSEKQNFQRISLLENKTTKDVGRPELPMLHELVGIPGNQKVKVTVLEIETMKLSGYHIYPFQTPTTDNPGGHDREFVMDQAFYAKDGNYPAENVVMSQPGIWRDVKVAGLHITPFTYNPAKDELTVITHLKVQVEFAGMDNSMSFNPDMQLTPKYYRMYEAAISNFGDLGYTETLREEVGVKYLVITNDEALDAIQPLVDWKNQMGHKVEVRTLEAGFEDPQHFKDYITTLYESDGLEYVLMVGDAYPNGGSAGGPNIVPMYYWNPGENPSYSDSWYTCLDGPDDHYADLAIGRFVYDANQLDELELQISKTMTHYLEPHDSDWAENTILIAHKEQYPGKYTQCCNEIASYNYSIQTPIFEKAYGGEAYSNAEVVEFVNDNGVGIFNYRGHGSQTQLWDWTSVSPGHFTAAEVAQLDNVNQLFVFFDVCCDNMDIVGYNGDCLCESFMKHPTASVAVNGAIIPSYTIPNHDYDKEMYKAVYDEGITNIGYVTNFANITVLNVHGSIGRSNVRTYLWLGDASVEPWTLRPRNLTVTHDDQLFLGVSEFTVNVIGEEGPAENAMVCVTNEDGSVYAVAYTDATGVAMVTFDEPVQEPGNATVTVTTHNYLPYQATIPVIPQSGPYVVKDSYVINDANGNGNGMMDYAESILLSLSVKNVGIQTAEDVVVTIATDDDYITITDGEENYGNIDPEAIVTVDDGFAFDVADNIPDGHAVLFEVSASDGTDTWTSNVMITGHAPVLELGEFTITDPAGNNNGKLDPGEEATITVTVLNTGSADAYTVMGDLMTGDMYLEITTTDP
ncbi:MAG: C25 family cysteine peptidase, partial [Bacteroidales bacterium]